MTTEAELDETVAATFPASDPAANTIVTGARIDTSRAELNVVDNHAASRLELITEGEVAFLTYERRDKSLVLIHTEVPPALRGRRIGDALVKAGLAAARTEGRNVVAVCPFVRAYLHKHPRKP